MLKGGYQIVDMTNIPLKYSRDDGSFIPYEATDKSLYDKVTSDKLLVFHNLSIDVVDNNGDVINQFHFNPITPNIYIAKGEPTVMTILCKDLILISEGGEPRDTTIQIGIHRDGIIEVG